MTSNSEWQGMTPQEILDSEVILTLPMLGKIWGINRTSAWRRLTKKIGLYSQFAYKDEGQWCIRKSDFMRVIAQARGKSEVVKERLEQDRDIEQVVK